MKAASSRCFRIGKERTVSLSAVSTERKDKNMNCTENEILGNKVDLLSLLPTELEALMLRLEEPKYRARQIFSQLHRGL